jgi:glutamyl-tRNA synthetase
MNLDKLAEMCAPYLEKAGLVEKIQNLKIKNQNDNSKFKISKTNEIISFEWIKKVIALEQERMKKISEIPELVGFVFADKLNYSAELLKWKKMDNKAIYDSLTLSQEKIYKIPEEKFLKENIEKSLRKIIGSDLIKLNTGELLWPLRAALTGLKFSPGPFEVAEVLGKEKCLKRIKEAKEKINILS